MTLMSEALVKELDRRGVEAWHMGDGQLQVESVNGEQVDLLITLLEDGQRAEVASAVRNEADELVGLKHVATVYLFEIAHTINLLWG